MAAVELLRCFLYTIPLVIRYIWFLLIYHLSPVDHPCVLSMASALVEFSFCLVASLIQCNLLAVVDGNLGVLLSACLVFTCILGCMLLCVWHQCLSSCLAFHCLCLLLYMCYNNHFAMNRCGLGVYNI